MSSASLNKTILSMYHTGISSTCDAVQQFPNENFATGSHTNISMHSPLWEIIIPQTEQRKEQKICLNYHGMPFGHGRMVGWYTISTVPNDPFSVFIILGRKLIKLITSCQLAVSFGGLSPHRKELLQLTCPVLC